MRQLCSEATQSLLSPAIDWKNGEMNVNSDVDDDDREVGKSCTAVAEAKLDITAVLDRLDRKANRAVKCKQIGRHHR